MSRRAAIAAAERRTCVVAFALTLCVCGVASPGAAVEPARIAADTNRPPVGAATQVHAVTVVGMTVADVTRSTAFFRNVLGFVKTSDVEVSGSEYDHLWGVSGVRARVVRLRLGREELELTQYRHPTGRRFPADSRSNDRWFQHIAIVVRDMDAAYARVRRHVRAISSGPQILPQSNVAAAGIAAFYFRDPDGHALELIHFPPRKGDPRWQEPGDGLFLGIDHTAIGVRSTATSLTFYRDLLGLRIAGESRNVGTEQEQLTGVPDAMVRITGLRAPAGPGIELLEYEAPGDGRDLPSPARSNDLVHWQATLTITDVTHAASALRDAGFAVLSPDVVTMPQARLGFSRALLVRDPDGHVLQLVEP